MSGATCPNCGIGLAAHMPGDIRDCMESLRRERAEAARDRQLIVEVHYEPPEGDSRVAWFAVPNPLPEGSRVLVAMVRQGASLADVTDRISEAGDE